MKISRRINDVYKNKNDIVYMLTKTELRRIELKQNLKNYPNQPLIN